MAIKKNFVGIDLITEDNINYRTQLQSDGQLVTYKLEDDGSWSVYDKSLHILNLTLPETSVLEVCKYIRENIPVLQMFHNSYHFNALVNNSDWFSGHMYNDGGSTYWGTILKRGISDDTNILYKYLSVGGADSVTPFSKSQPNAVRNIGANPLQSSGTINTDLSEISVITNYGLPYKDPSFVYVVGVGFIANSQNEWTIQNVSGGSFTFSKTGTVGYNSEFSVAGR